MVKELIHSKSGRAADFCRFMSFVRIPTQVSDCWLWVGGTMAQGYGHFSVSNHTIRAHRWIYSLIHGAIEEGLVVRHKCDNPTCVNPMHLEVGSHAENCADMHQRGRNADRKGEKHPMASFTAEDVLDIRLKRELGWSLTEIGKLYGKSEKLIGKITRRERWKHI